MSATTLLAVPNVSEGRDAQLIGEMTQAFDARLLDVHADPDHNRTVLTLAGPPGTLAAAVLRGAREARSLVDVSRHEGAHPRIGAIDVAPIVYLRDSDRGAACAEALVLADLLGEHLELPVFLYGALAGGRTRAELRRGGPAALAERIETGELRPDFGPDRLHPTAGAVLVAARPPLVAFNVELAPPATLADAKAIAAAVREGAPDGLASVRAIGVWLERRGVAQVSTNVEDHRCMPLASVIAAIGRHATVTEAELVGLAPRAAFEAFPHEIPVRGRATIEDALAAAGIPPP
jgi:glutamate formiminotransferase